MNDPLKKLFSPFSLGPIELRNRFIKAATFEGMSPNGQVSKELIEHHRSVCEGGVAMTTVAYCSVSKDGRTYDTQLLMQPAISDGLGELTHAVHKSGAKACIQLGHCGDFAEKKVIKTSPIGPSKRFNLYGLSFCRAMTKGDMDRIAGDFESAAAKALEVGFDAVEIHAGHGYLLSQFLSPYTNRRKDEWGGPLENRLKFPLQVINVVERVVAGKAALFVKMNLCDGFEGGISADDMILSGQAFCGAGADALVGSGGFVSKAPLYMLRGDVPTRDMVKAQKSWVRKIGLSLFGPLFVKHTPFEETFFLDPAKKLVAAVNKPVVLLGGVLSLKSMCSAANAGFELFGLGRAVVRDPNFVKRLEAKEIEMSDCDHCNRCIAAMDAGGLKCVSSISLPST